MGSVSSGNAPIPQWQPQVIQPGDTLWNLATEHATTVGEIVDHNRIADPNVIYAGDQLLLPSFQEPVVPPVVVSPTPPPTVTPTPDPGPSPDGPTDGPTDTPPVPTEEPPTTGGTVESPHGEGPTDGPPTPGFLPNEQPTFAPYPRTPVRRTEDPVVPAPTTPAPADTRDPNEVGTPASGFVGGLSSMISSVGNTLTDVGSFVGVKTDDDGNLQAGVDPLSLSGFGAVALGPTALMALGNRTDAVSGAVKPYWDNFGATAAGNTIKVTPTLVSAVLGPAIADGVTMIAPNLVKKYKDPKDIKLAEEKKQAEKDNQTAKISRAIAGGVVVGLAAGAVFLLKPDLFKKFGAGVTHAIEGSTQFTVDGKMNKLAGVLSANQIRSAMSKAGTPLAKGTSINILKTVMPMAKDAVFSNRALVAAAGGIGTVLLANKAAGEDDPAQQKLWWGITGAAALATVGATYGVGKMTEGSIRANGGAGGILSKNTLLMKPNIEWIKKYATTIAPITAVPAGTAASQYFNVVNDFDEITGARSPFRK